MSLQEGKDYYFTDRPTFERGIKAGKFLEHAEVHGNLYGTTYKAVEVVGQSGRCCILDIDVQGARLVRCRAVTCRLCFVFTTLCWDCMLASQMLSTGT